MFGHFSLVCPGWSDGAMVLGKLLVPGLIWIIIGQRPTVLAVDAGGGCLDFSLMYHCSLPFLSGRRLV